MKVKIKHNFKTKCHNLIGLFDGVHKMSTFMSRLERQSLKDPDRYDPDKYKGDGFEFFVELFLMLHPNDNRVGIHKYQPVQENDNGVDGIGVNILKQKSVVQIKYRSNTQYYLTTNEDHLGNLIVDGMGKYNVVYAKERKNYRHFIFTTAKGLNYYTDQEVFKSRVKCFAIDDFKAMLNNNMIFWTDAFEIIKKLK